MKGSDSNEERTDHLILSRKALHPFRWQGCLSHMCSFTLFNKYSNSLSLSLSLSLATNSDSHAPPASPLCGQTLPLLAGFLVCILIITILLRDHRGLGLELGELLVLTVAVVASC